jgi:hypothetical protein
VKPIVSLVVAVFVVVALLPLPVVAQDASPESALGAGITILPPEEEVYGKSHGEWAAEWWAWTLRPESAECGPSADGRVWFLPPVSSGAAELTGLRFECTLPADAALFYAILVNAGPDTGSCEAGITAVLETFGGLDSITILIDGRPVPDLGGFRLASAVVPAPATPTAGSPAATPEDVLWEIACGYGFILAPLPAGEHVTKLTVESEGNVVVDLTQEITVTNDA